MPSMAILRQRFIDLLPELMKFGTVGAIGAILDLGGAAYLHGKLGVGPLSAKAASVCTSMVFTFLGSRFWTFRHRVNQPLLRQASLFAGLNMVGLAIAEVVIAVVSYGLDDKSALAYNAASLAGTGLAMVFRYLSYKKWVFLAGGPAAAVAAGEAAVSGLAAVGPVQEQLSPADSDARR